MLVRTKLPALNLSALPKVRMTVPVILGRAGRSSVPSLNHSPLHLPAAIGGAIPTSALARSCSITLFASSFNACAEASLIFPI